jgi:uncharacterized protein YndB with AHSA1/START domain
MQTDFSRARGADERDVKEGSRDGKPTRVVVASRVYATDAPDLWDAITNPERLPRWFLPLTGELKPGGRYQLEGNAGGTITRCEPPSILELTWEFGGGVSWVAVLLESEEGGTRLTLEHAAPTDEIAEEHWKMFGPGAVGVGWDLALMGLGMHVESGASVDPAESGAWLASEEGKQVVKACATAWGRAHVASGESEEIALAMAERTRAAYAGES